MRIGLYGDSYGVANGLPTSWTSLLEEKLGCAITNYSESGSSVYYSYTKFFETHDQYDTVIFLVTEPIRYPVEVDFSEAVPRGLRHVSSINVVYLIRELLENSLSSLDRKLLADVEGWYKASDIDYINTVHNLFIQRILSLHPNVILYPCFPTSLSDSCGINSEHTLFNLFIKQLTLLGIDITVKNVLHAGGHENKQVISGHLAPEFNAIFADVMYSRITTNQWNCEAFSDVRLNHPKEYYYVD